MQKTLTRLAGLGLAASLTLMTAVSGTPAVAADRQAPAQQSAAPAPADESSQSHKPHRPWKPWKPWHARHRAKVQMLSFNDFHGHLEATDGPLSIEKDPSQTPVGGAEYLATKLNELRAEAPKKRTITVAAGDLIGGSPFLSGLFHDEPAVDSLNAMGLDISSVGNHEFDEGTDELLRMQRGGCHPDDGCYFPYSPYPGADFDWLAANVVKKGKGHGTLLPGTKIERIKGVKVGFIGMTLEATPTLVSPAGVATVEFKDEVRTANREAWKLRLRGVKAIVVLLHEGGYHSGTYNGCEGISAPIAQIAARMTPMVDQIVTGHTHEPYVCSLPDPRGRDRLVTSAASYGRVVTESTLVINRWTRDIDRRRSTATNHLVTRDSADPEQTAIIDKWSTLSAQVGARVIGTVAEDILGDSGGDRAIETPMADLVSDSILAATDGEDEGGAQISFMNVGGVRASLPVAPKYDENPGDVTYQEGYDVLPFGNRIVTVTMTGSQIEEALEQQYQPVADRGSRPMLALGVSEGFSYAWDGDQPQGSRVVPGSMTLNGTQIDADGTYRVSMYNFLQEGGDLFSAFTQGTDLTGGPEDLSAFEDYLGANPDLTAPESRVSGL